MQLRLLEDLTEAGKPASALYVVTWWELEQTGDAVVAVCLSAESAIDTVEALRRERRVVWKGLWEWRRAYDHNWPKKWRQIIRRANSPEGWPGTSRDCFFSIEAVLVT